MIRSAALLLLLLPLLTACPSGDLVLNEFVASNATGHTDEGGAYPDWVELHNPTSSAISLSGYAISDDPTLPERHLLDASMEIPAGGYQVLFADGDTVEGITHLPFRLSAGGEELLLSHDVGDGYEVIDQLVFGEQATDTATARVPDGTGEWTTGVTPTPGETNG
jgi:hypothetical protein